MKSVVLFLVALSSITALVRGNVIDLETRRTKGDYVQKAKGNATFTVYFGCNGNGACGHPINGFSAAMSQLSFGAPPNGGPGDCCGRTFRLTATKDPYSPHNVEDFKSIVVIASDLCPASPPGAMCSQTREHPLNEFGATVNFDLCAGTGAAAAFFPENIGALFGHYEEVAFSEWEGSIGPPAWNGACVAGDKAPFWGQHDSTGCGNVGEAP